ncbi:hypothetical protein GQ600_13139 [Phytophthora cactorum]|nr:hypothetical protein GQ600_13139 [Phytophthora cactorum]
MVSQWCWILTDGFSVLGCSYVITLSKPLKELKPFRPTSSLIGPTTLFFGSRYRQPIWKNNMLMGFVAVLAAIDLYLLLGEPSAVMDQFRISSSTNVVGLPDIPCLSASASSISASFWATSLSVSSSSTSSCLAPYARTSGRNTTQTRSS